MESHQKSVIVDSNKAETGFLTKVGAGADAATQPQSSSRTDVAAHDGHGDSDDSAHAITNLDTTMDTTHECTDDHRGNSICILFVGHIKRRSQ